MAVHESKTLLTADDKTATATRSASRNFRRVNDDTRRGLAAQKRSLQDVKKEADVVGKAMKGLGAVMVGDFFRRGLTVAATMERNVNAIGIEIGKTRAELPKFREDMRQLSKGVNLDVSEMVAAIDIFGDAAQKDFGAASKHIGSINDAAKLLQLPIDETSRAVGGMVRQFGVADDDVGKAIDSLRKGIYEFNLETADVIGKVEGLGGAFADMGYTGEKGVATLLHYLGRAKLDTGKTRSAIAGLEGILENIQEPSEALAKSLGTSAEELTEFFQRVQENGGDVIAVFADMVTKNEKAFNTLDKNEKKIVSGMKAHAATRRDEIRRLQGDVKSLHEAASIMNDDLAEAQKRMGLAWQDLLGAAGRVLGGLDQGIGKLVGNNSAIRALADEMRDIAESIDAINKGDWKKAFDLEFLELSPEERRKAAREKLYEFSPSRRLYEWWKGGEGEGGGGQGGKSLKQNMSFPGGTRSMLQNTALDPRRSAEERRLWERVLNEYDRLGTVRLEAARMIASGEGGGGARLIPARFSPGGAAPGGWRGGGGRGYQPGVGGYEGEGYVPGQEPTAPSFPKTAPMTPGERRSLGGARPRGGGRSGASPGGIGAGPSGAGPIAPQDLSRQPQPHFPEGGAPGALGPAPGGFAGNAAMRATPGHGPIMQGALGISASDWDAYRYGMASIEGGTYHKMGGSSGRFAGAYQLGMKGRTEVSSAAARLGESTPSQSQFLGDPAMQERFFDSYTKGNHDYLMKNSPQYRAMSGRDKLKTLGYAHNQGPKGARDWLSTGRAGRDAWGTSGAAYPKAIQRELSARDRAGMSGEAAGAPAAKAFPKADTSSPSAASQPQPVVPGNRIDISSPSTATQPQPVTPGKRTEEVQLKYRGTPDSKQFQRQSMRKEVNREVRQARYNSYSDIGAA
jgi:hypothetical protein